MYTTLSEKKIQTFECFEVLIQEFSVEEIFVAWTGGKDSTVVLSLWIQFLGTRMGRASRPVKALNIDTGCKFPEVMAFRDRQAAQWGLQLEVLHPDTRDLAMGPEPEDPVACCRRLKVEPLRQAVQNLGVAVLMTGIRHDEHHSRRIETWRELRQDPEYVQVHPVLHWNEMDIWAHHLQEGLPYCELYDQGYRSLGCRPCTRCSETDERSGRNQDKEDQLHVLRSLGYF